MKTLGTLNRMQLHVELGIDSEQTIRCLCVCVYLRNQRTACTARTNMNICVLPFLVIVILCCLPPLEAALANAARGAIPSQLLIWEHPGPYGPIPSPGLVPQVELNRVARRCTFKPRDMIFKSS